MLFCWLGIGVDIDGVIVVVVGMESGSMLGSQDYLDSYYGLWVGAAVVVCIGLVVQLVGYIEHAVVVGKQIADNEIEQAAKEKPVEEVENMIRFQLVIYLWVELLQASSQ